MHGVIGHLQITGILAAISGGAQRLAFILGITLACLTGIMGGLGGFGGFGPAQAQAHANAQTSSNGQKPDCQSDIKRDTQRDAHSDIGRHLRIALPEVIELGQGVGPVSLFDIEKTGLAPILEETGYCADFHLLPWLRADSQIKRGALDGFVSTQNIGWYRRDYYISDRFAEIDIFVLTHPDKFKPDGYAYEDLANLHVAVFLGDSLGFELSGRGIPYVTLPTTANLTRFLLAKRVDAVLGYRGMFEKSASDALKNGLLAMSHVGKRELYLMIYREVYNAKAIIDGLNAQLR